jgi:FAD/FMN-containing dehydrogenase
MSDTITSPEHHLSDLFGGETLVPDQPGYDHARAMYNGSIDSRPALIVQPRSASDVIDAVNYARETGLPIAARCGGHAVSGTSIVEDGILVDLSTLKGIHVDTSRRTAIAQGGVLWGEYDRDTTLHGYATPGGRVTTTGIGGFTLGGGYGWLSTALGLTCDNLVSADLVTADGRLVHVTEDEHPDLLWGLRGAGANYGIVTSFEYQLHPIEPMVLGGMLVVPNNDDAAAFARGWRDYVLNASENLMSGLATLLAPPLPVVPPEIVGTPVVGVVAMYYGPVEDGEEHLAPLRELAAGGMDLVQPMPYTVFQTLLDPLSPKGMLNYHRGQHLDGLSDESLDNYLEVGRSIHSPLTQGVIFRHGGAISRVPEMATAASNRSAPFMAHPIAAWDTPDKTEYERAWVDRFSEALTRDLTGGVYLNFEPGTSANDVIAGFGEEKYDRLVALKDEWDPDNLFRANHNIAPTGWSHVSVPRQSPR